MTSIVNIAPPLAASDSRDQREDRLLSELSAERSAESVITPPVSAAFAFDTTASTEDDEITGETLRQIEELTDLALEAWSRYLGGVAGARLEAEVTVAEIDSLASARAGTFAIDRTLDDNGSGRFDAGDRVVAAPGTLIELRSGFDPNGAEADIFITVSAERLRSGDFFLDTTLDRTVPGRSFDLFSVLLHEIGHGLGFSSFADDVGVFSTQEFGPPGGRFDAVVLSGFDLATTITDDGRPVFTGEAALAAFGAPVPIEFTTGEPGSDLSHFLAGQPAGSPPSDLRAALLNPFIFPGERSEIGALEIAVLEDIGFDIIDRPDVLLNAFDSIPESSLPFVRIESNADGAVLLLDRTSPFVRTSGSVAFEAQGVTGDVQTGRALFAPRQGAADLDLDIGTLGPLAFVDLFGPLQLRLAQTDISAIVDTQTGRAAQDPFDARTFGTASDDVSAGSAGRDLIVGAAGSDRLTGGIGDDVLFGDDVDAGALLDAIDGFA